MKAINNQEHQTLMRALEQLHNGSPNDDDSKSTLTTEYQCLTSIFNTYQTLLSQLAICIADYERKHHYIRVTLVAPALRNTKKKLGQNKHP